MQSTLCSGQHVLTSSRVNHSASLLPRLMDYHCFVRFDGTIYHLRGLTVQLEPSWTLTEPRFQYGATSFLQVRQVLVHYLDEGMSGANNDLRHLPHYGPQCSLPARSTGSRSPLPRRWSARRLDLCLPCMGVENRSRGLVIMSRSRMWQLPRKHTRFILEPVTLLSLHLTPCRRFISLTETKCDQSRIIQTGPVAISLLGAV